MAGGYFIYLQFWSSEDLGQLIKIHLGKIKQIKKKKKRKDEAKEIKTKIKLKPRVRSIQKMCAM